jgi:hypothetical protein
MKRFLLFSCLALGASCTKLPPAPEQAQVSSANDEALVWTKDGLARYVLIRGTVDWSSGYPPARLLLTFAPTGTERQIHATPVDYFGRFQFNVPLKTEFVPGKDDARLIPQSLEMLFTCPGFTWFRESVDILPHLTVYTVNVSLSAATSSPTKRRP